MKSKVLLVSYLLLMVSSLALPQALIQCDKNATKEQLCSLYDKYEKGTSDFKITGKPMSIKSSITMLKIAELDQNKNTITLNVLLSIFWNDTRITIESNTPNGYVVCKNP
jgi:hypothetical protein